MRRLLVGLALVPMLALGATTPQGVALKVRRGFFTETDIGTFFTLGGHDVYSNAQSYFQVGVGVDISDKLELGAHFGLGANAFNCFAARTENGVCTTSEAFTVTFFDATAAYLIRLRERLYLAPKIAAGYALLDPSPRAGLSHAFNAGAGVGVEYATSMDHFSVGLDVLGRYVFSGGMLAITIFPRVKYTF